jgi:hypothetical protein
MKSSVFENWMAYYVFHGMDEKVNAALTAFRSADIRDWLRYYGVSEGTDVFRIFGKLVVYRHGWDPDGARWVRWEKWWVDGKEIDPSDTQKYLYAWLREQAIEAGVVVL